MSDIRFSCSRCSQTLAAPDDMAGESLACPGCAAPLTIPKQIQISQVPTQEMKACPFCSERILASAAKCKHCGEFMDGRNKQPDAGSKSIMEFEARKKSPGLAAFLNFLIPGLGYMYCGNYVIGILAFLFVLFVGIVTLGLALFITVPVMIIDGVLCAGRANRNLAKKMGQKLK